MRRLLIAIPVILGLGVLATTFWLYGTTSGRTWRLNRLSTADLMARTLSHPEDTQAQRLLGRRLLSEGKPDEAAAAFAAAATAAPETAWPLTAQARALIQADKPTQALAPLEEALRRRPNDADTLCALGEAYYALGDRTGAERQFRQVLRSDPANATAQAELVFVLADNHNFEQARQIAQKASAQSPDSSLAQTALGYVEDEAGNEPKAIRALTRATELDPANGRAWTLLATTRIRTAHTPEEFAQSEQSLSRAEALLPNSALLPYQRGLLRMKQRNYTEAISAFQRALERSPRFTDALYNLSVCLAYTGQTRESAAVRARFERLRDYDRAVETLLLRLTRDSSRADLWRTLRKLAQEQNDDARVRLADRQLQTLGGDTTAKPPQR